jgi:hypothetical protein
MEPVNELALSGPDVTATDLAQGPSRSAAVERGPSDDFIH